MERSELVNYLNDFLQCHQFTDYAPNGLQVTGAEQITNIVTAVTAAQEVIDYAVEQKAQAILVHHGYFWKGEDPCITGIKHTRLATLLKHNINLLAYHLPLDAHPTIGNNIQLGLLLGMTQVRRCNNGLLCVGQFTQTQTVPQLTDLITQKLHRAPQVVMANNKPIKTLAWSTGAAQDSILEAKELGVDAFLSGEISERTYYLAKELNINYYAAGHHATERCGIQALGEDLAKTFDLQVIFKDTDNFV